MKWLIIITLLFLNSCFKKDNYDYGVTKKDINTNNCEQIKDIKLYCIYKLQQLNSDYLTSFNESEKELCIVRIKQYRNFLKDLSKHKCET